MYLTGQFDLQWGMSEIFLANFSGEGRLFSIRFHDANGGIVHDTGKQEIKPFGVKTIKLASMKSLHGRSGLFIINGGVGISGECRYRADDGILRTAVSLKEGLPPFSLKGFTVFISYAMRKENDALYRLVSRFMKAMGFTVVSASENGRSDLPPGAQITKMINESDALLAMLTKDTKTQSTKFQPSQNVIDEIGQAAGKPNILIVEDGTEVPSNIQTRATYILFERRSQEEMLVNLIEKLRQMKLI